MNQNIRLSGKFSDVMRDLRFKRLNELTEKIIEDGPVKHLEYEFKELDAGDREYVLCGVRDWLKERESALFAAQMDLQDIQRRIEELDDSVSSLKDIESDLEYWNRLRLEEENEDGMSELESRGMAYSDFLAGA
jgi:hypothetical protein